MKPQILLKQPAILLLLFVFSSLLITVKPQAQIKYPKQQQQAHNSDAVSSNKFPLTNLSYKIIDAPNETFGYDIYDGGHKMIHQPSIPALPGNNGFTTKNDVEKVAQHVIQKIQNGEMPPTVTIEEMKKLKVIKQSGRLQLQPVSLAK